jgi:hypothetical protein
MRGVRWLVLIAVLAGLPGCTVARLRQRTVNQGSSLPELQSQQVLGNLALFAANPAALPWHVNLREGTTQITDSATGGALVDANPPTILQPQLFGSRTAVAQWGMSPVIDPIELQLLRIAYRRAHGSPEMPSVELLADLAHELKDQMASNSDLRDESEVFYEVQAATKADERTFDARVITTNDPDFVIAPDDPARPLSPLARNVRRKIDALQMDLARIQPGWFHVGKRRDVPRSACYVGRNGDCCVWVEADGAESLTDFTLTVMKLSTLIKETQTLISPGSVKFSPGDRGG